MKFFYLHNVRLFLHNLSTRHYNYHNVGRLTDCAGGQVIFQVIFQVCKEENTL